MVSPPFGRALLGSTIGVALGVPFGVIMVRGALDDERWDDRSNSPRHECCLLKRLGIGALGVAFVAGGGAVGAATSVSQSGIPVYGGAVAGQVLLGGIGYGIGSQLGPGETSVAQGLIVGMPLAAVGAAIGAVLGAREGTSQTGGLQFRDGEWTVRVPEVQVRPGIGDQQRSAVDVTLVSAQF